jgi:hypothetical protein
MVACCYGSALGMPKRKSALSWFSENIQAAPSIHSLPAAAADEGHGSRQKAKAGRASQAEGHSGDLNPLSQLHDAARRGHSCCLTRGHMQLRLLTYTAIAVPVVAAAFVAGIVFERQRVQTLSIQQPPAIASRPSEAGSTSKAEQDPAPYQAATTSKGEHDPSPRSKQASRHGKISEGMQAIENAWREAIDAEQLLAVKTGVCYGARFIRRGADLRAGLAKMNGASDPDVGIIRITGMTAENKPTGKYTCFASIAEALAANRRASESLEPLDATLIYKITNAEIRLDRIESEPGWLAIAVNDNVRLKLGSWKAVSTQPIDPN